jgi:hypothetical protein
MIVSQPGEKSKFLRQPLQAQLIGRQWPLAAIAQMSAKSTVDGVTDAHDEVGVGV